MPDTPIVLCSRGPTVYTFQALLKELQLPALTCGTLDEADAASHGGHGLIIVDFDTFTPDADECWRRVILANPHAKILAIASRVRPAEVGELFVKYRMTNLLARNGEVNPNDFKSTVEKILNGNIFGVGRYFAAGTQIISQEIHGSAGKDQCLAAIAQYAEQAQIKHRLIEQLVTITDEMVSNAVYDAPVDKAGKHRYAHFDRTEPVQLEPHEAARLSFAADGKRAAIAVEDPFGTLPASHVLDYLTKCFRQEADQIDQKQGGAGLGLYFIFRSVSHFVVNIDVGRRTELIGILDLTNSFREFANRSKSFNLFVEDR